MNKIKKFVALFLATIIAVNTIPIYPTDSNITHVNAAVYNGQSGGGGYKGRGGGGTYLIAQGAQYTIIDYKTGKNIYQPVWFAVPPQINNMSNVVSV